MKPNGYKVLTCPHVTRKRPMCGAFTCMQLACDECYPGHVLERHMFDTTSMWAAMWRDSSIYYNSKTLERAELGRKLCGQTKPLSAYETWTANVGERVARAGNRPYYPKPRVANNSTPVGPDQASKSKGSKGTKGKKATRKEGKT